MATRSIDVMLSKPGIYIVFWCGSATFLEVDAEGRCWQLTLSDYRRDGELRPGGWVIDTIQVIHGPFARSA